MKCAIKTCDQPLDSAAHCTVHQSARDEAARVLGLPEDYERFVHRIPVSHGAIHHTEEVAWREKHAHPEREYRGAIGGSFSTLSAESSLGDMRTLQCVICRQEVFIDDDH